MVLRCFVASIFDRVQGSLDGRSCQRYTPDICRNICSYEIVTSPRPASPGALPSRSEKIKAFQGVVF
ncbi:uncharacterized protein ARMOST_15135 [Armillaria ostoyae]|uniref:Uncharacterized protein n=1 Tax=Armillaria ostoyae TaxID=47428 RepID=A0A284RSI7_ARMOS|nr:uncharacterized protein ARMOST_15135 [Armillaria ostoyae]